MNYAAKELTTSLQELTSRSEQQFCKRPEPLPTSITQGDTTLSKEVDTFLEKTREYSARTKNANVGTY
jgi:hypothetical protein